MIDVTIAPFSVKKAITQHTSSTDAIRVASKEDLARLDTKTIVALHNAFSPVSVTRFRLREDAVERTWRLIEREAMSPIGGKTMATKQTKDGQSPKAKTATEKQAGGEAEAPKRTRMTVFREMLEREEGVNRDELAKAFKDEFGGESLATVGAVISKYPKQGGFETVVGQDAERGRVYYMKTPKVVERLAKEAAAAQKAKEKEAKEKEAAAEGKQPAAGGAAKKGAAKKTSAAPEAGASAPEPALA